jgi:hypothetical protein
MERLVRQLVSGSKVRFRLEQSERSHLMAPLKRDDFPGL